MKTFAIANHTGSVSVVTAKNLPNDGQPVKNLSVTDSTLALRYGVVDGVIVDKFPTQTDEQILTDILAGHVAQAALEAVSELSVTKRNKIAQVRQHFDGIVSGLKADGASYEVDTWATQKEEYMLWIANNAAMTPYVDALAVARQVDKTALMGKIGAKVVGLASLQGSQHFLEKLIETATTAEEVAAVTF